MEDERRESRLSDRTHSLYAFPLTRGEVNALRSRSADQSPATDSHAVHIHPRFGQRSRMGAFGRPGLFCDEAAIAGVEMVREPFL